MKTASVGIRKIQHVNKGCECPAEILLSWNSSDKAYFIEKYHPLHHKETEEEPLHDISENHYKLQAIEVDLKSYFDDDAKVGLEHLLKSLLSTVICRNCDDTVEEDMVQVKCSSCFHTFHARLCAGLSYVPKKEAWLCPECL